MKLGVRWPAVAGVAMAMALSAAPAALAQAERYCWINSQTGKAVPGDDVVPQGSRLDDGAHASIPAHGPAEGFPNGIPSVTFVRAPGGGWINAQTGKSVPDADLVPQGSRLDDDNHASIPAHGPAEGFPNGVPSVTFVRVPCPAAAPQTAVRRADAEIGQALLARINQVRADPPAYAHTLGSANSPAALEAMVFLEHQAPVAALTGERMLSQAAAASPTLGGFTFTVEAQSPAALEASVQRAVDGWLIDADMPDRIHRWALLGKDPYPIGVVCAPSGHERACAMFGYDPREPWAAIREQFTGHGSDAQGLPLTAGGIDPVVREINVVRADPAAYAQVLRGASHSPASLDAQAALGRLTTSLPPLTVNPALSAVAASYLADQASHGIAGHTGSDGSTALGRLTTAGILSTITAEDIALGEPTAAGAVRKLIIDEGVIGALHRSDLLNPYFVNAGVACGPHPRWREMCVIELTGQIRVAGGEEAAANRATFDAYVATEKAAAEVERIVHAIGANGVGRHCPSVAQTLELIAARHHLDEAMFREIDMREEIQPLARAVEAAEKRREAVGRLIEPEPVDITRAEDDLAVATVRLEGARAAARNDMIDGLEDDYDLFLDSLPIVCPAPE